MKSNSTPENTHLSDEEITSLLLEKFDTSQLQAYYATEKTTIESVKNKLFGRTSEALLTPEEHSDTEDNGNDNNSENSDDTSNQEALLNKLTAIVNEEDSWRSKAKPIKKYLNLAKARLGALVVSEGTNSNITISDPNKPNDANNPQITGTAKQVLNRMIADRLAALKNPQKTSASTENTTKSGPSKISWRKRQNNTAENPEDKLPKKAVTILNWAVDIVHQHFLDNLPEHIRTDDSNGVIGEGKNQFKRITGIKNAELRTYLVDQVNEISSTLVITENFDNGRLISLNHEKLGYIYQCYLLNHVNTCIEEKNASGHESEVSNKYIDDKLKEAGQLFLTSLPRLEDDLLRSFALTTFSSENELDENPPVKRQAVNILFSYFSKALLLKVDYENNLLSLTSNLSLNNLNEIFTGIYHFLNDHRNSEFLRNLPDIEVENFWNNLASRYENLPKKIDIDLANGRTKTKDWAKNAKDIEDLALILRFKTHYQALQQQKEQEGKSPDNTLDLKAQVCEQLFDHPVAYLQAQNNEETDSALTRAYHVAANAISQNNFRGSMLARNTIGTSSSFNLLLISSRSYGQIPTSYQLFNGLYRVRPSSLTMYQRNLDNYFDKLKEIPTDTQEDDNGEIPVETKIQDALKDGNQPTLDTAKLCAKVYFLNAVCLASKNKNNAALSTQDLSDIFDSTKRFFENSHFSHALFTADSSTNAPALISNYEQLLSIGRGTIADLSSNWPALFSGTSKVGREMAAEIKQLATFSS